MCDFSEMLGIQEGRDFGKVEDDNNKNSSFSSCDHGMCGISEESGGGIIRRGIGGVMKIRGRD